MSSSFGSRFRFTIFGQSHSEAIGVTVEGLPAGTQINLEALQAHLSRRSPGGELSSGRQEADQAEFLSGLVNGVTCGAPLTAIIRNTDARRGDYAAIADCPRPGHADYPAQVRFGGAQDASGGGHFSGRLTAPLCIAGGICLQILEKMGITVGAHIVSIGGIEDRVFDPVSVSAAELAALKDMAFPVLEPAAGERMRTAVLEAKARGDSLGGVIECAAVGLPAGWGDPMFDGMENRIAQAVFGIPAVRGIEFGAGFDAARMSGSEHNDLYCGGADGLRTRTNRHGGVLGGMTTGMPLIFRVAVKPTPSIGLPQRTADYAGAERTLEIGGRHDPCIVPRAVAAVESAAAAALYDAYLCTK